VLGNLLDNAVKYARFELRLPLTETLTETGRTARPTPGRRPALPDAPAEGLANAAVSR
jgi:hypothetical protein